MRIKNYFNSRKKYLFKRIKILFYINKYFFMRIKTFFDAKFFTQNKIVLLRK